MSSEIKGSASQPPPPPPTTAAPRAPMRSGEKVEKEEHRDHDEKHRGIASMFGEERMGKQVARLGRKLMGKDWMHDLEEHEDENKVAERFQKLTRSLGEAFGGATQVDRVTGEEEMKEGALKKVGKDLEKLFRASGFAKELSRAFAKEVAGALANAEGTETLQFSLSTARLVHLEASRVQASYLSGSQGTALEVNETSFEFSAVRFRSLDITINLATGELTAEHSALDAVSVEASEARVLAAATGDPAAQLRAARGHMPEAEATPLPGEIGGEPGAGEALVADEMAAAEPAGTDPEPFFRALGAVTSSVRQLETFMRLSESSFESSFAVRDPREEEDEDGNRWLRFTLDTLTPLGLTERDEDGRGSTVYPRPSGDLGRIDDGPVDVSA